MSALWKVASLMVLISLSSRTDCVLNAKSKTQWVRLDSHTVMLKGGLGPDIIIKTLAFINNSSELQVLKDNFCSYEPAVLYIDGEVVDAAQVTRVQ